MNNNNIYFSDNLMVEFSILTSFIGFILCALAVIHVFFDIKENRLQRILMLITLFCYAVIFEYIGIETGNHVYARDVVMIFGQVALSIPLAWVGIIYSTFIIAERLELSTWKRILTTSLISLSLDWGMDPIAVKMGLWTWLRANGAYFGVPSFNFIGWFFIPIMYLISYSFNWNAEKRRLKLLSINEIDTHDTLYRKLYTLFLVIPIAIGFLLLTSILYLIPTIYNLPIFIVIPLEILSIGGVSLAIILKRDKLKRLYWKDMIPPCTLLFIALDYGFIGLFQVDVLLGFLMFVTSIPLFLIFIFTFRKKNDTNPESEN